MNNRDLMMGLIPSSDFQKQHAFDTLRHFPELRKSLDEIKNIITPPSTTDEMADKNGWDDSYGLMKRQKRQQINREISFRSTYKLDALKKTSIDEFKTMADFRKVLLENRKKNGLSLSSLPLHKKINQESVDNNPTGDVYDPLKAANEKLSKVSLSYDSLMVNSPLLAFDGTILQKNQFQTLLRRCLNITLKKEEIDALFINMDVSLICHMIY